MQSQMSENMWCPRLDYFLYPGPTHLTKGGSLASSDRLGLGMTDETIGVC